MAMDLLDDLAVRHFHDEEGTLYIFMITLLIVAYVMTIINNHA